MNNKTIKKKKAKQNRGSEKNRNGSNNLLPRQVMAENQGYKRRFRRNSQP
jgi:hypothetical protein